MSDTRERILCAALELFSRDGYEAVSVSDIAGALGITKGALYRHFKNKRDIFDSILSRMERRDAEQAQASGVPEGTAEAMAEDYAGTTPEQLIAFSREMFRYWTGDPFAARFRRMLTLEQHRDAEMARLYQQYLASGPMGYVAELFAAMGVPHPERAAAAFYGPMFLLYSVYDGAADGGDAPALLDALMDDWLEKMKGGSDHGS